MINIKDKIRKLLYGDDMNPLPMKVIGPLFMLMFIAGTTKFIVFPFLPKLVGTFGISEKDTGYYVGLIGSSLFFGEALMSFVWGYLADTIGNKRSLLSSATLLLLTSCAFGFTKSITWAFVTRFLQGCSLGIYIISKSIAAKTGDETNVALAMSIVITGHMISFVGGPGIGGFLSFPADLYPNTFSKDSIFGQFGVLLVNLVLCCFIVINIILCILLLPQDERTDKKNDEKFFFLSNKERRIEIHCYNSVQSSNKKLKNQSVGIENEGFHHSANSTYIEKTAICQSEEPTNEYQIIVNDSTQDDNKTSRIKVLFRSKECLLTCVLYGLYAICVTSYDELFPLYAATSKKDHGYGFNTKQIGTALLVVALILLPISILLIPKILKKIGAKQLFIGSTLMQAMFYISFPLISHINHSDEFMIPTLVLLFIVRMGIFTSFYSINVMVNNSVKKHMLGVANGLAMTSASIGRTIAPFLIGSIYSWSLKNTIGFPFNYYFAFIFIQFLALCNVLLAAVIPNNINRSKK